MNRGTPNTLRQACEDAYTASQGLNKEQAIIEIESRINDFLAQKICVLSMRAQASKDSISDSAIMEVWDKIKRQAA